MSLEDAGGADHIHLCRHCKEPSFYSHGKLNYQELEQKSVTDFHFVRLPWLRSGEETKAEENVSKTTREEAISVTQPN